MSPSATADLAQATQAGALAAVEAGLRYVSDADAGLRRVRNGNGFVYRRHDGSRVDDDATLARIQALAIPPAWTDVWICPSPRGHLQASGRDARGRKQYRYHAQWSEVRGNGKFDRVIAFGQALPKLRRRLRRDLKADGFPREKVLAIVVAVLAETLIRVGNPEYARSNRSFGLTTLRNRHVAFVRGGRARFRFPRKGRARARRRARRCAAGAAGAPLPAAAGTGAVPVPRRRRQRGAGGIGGSQRLPARRHRRRVHREGFPHMGRHARRVPALRAHGAAASPTTARRRANAR